MAVQATTEATTIPRAAQRRLGVSRPRHGERLIRGLLLLCALLSVVTTVLIIISLLRPTLEFFSEVSLREFYTTREWSPLFADAHFGMAPLALATIATTVCALLVCMPLGLGTAIYLNEYASHRARGVLKPALELLAGIPTVVYGFFALTFITPLLRDIWVWGEAPHVFNGLSAGLVMGVMILPTVASLSEDAMAAVPHSLRAGAYALGATRFEVSTRVVVPAALSGIVGSFVLAISRAVGETMIVLIAAGGTPNFTLDPREAMQTMTAFIAAAGIGDQAVGTTGYKTIFAVGSTLFVATFIMNAFSIRLVRKYREAYE